MFCLYTLSCTWGSPWHGSHPCWRRECPLAPSVTLNRLCSPTWMSRPWCGPKRLGWGAWDLGRAGSGRQLASPTRSPLLASRRVWRPSAQPLLPGAGRRGRAAGVAPATAGCPATSSRRSSRARRRPIGGPSRKQVSLGQSPPPPASLPLAPGARLGANYRNCGGRARARGLGRPRGAERRAQEAAPSPSRTLASLL